MIISVWGSQGSGKSLLSTRLAIGLSELGKKVLTIYTEAVAVDIAWIYPEEKEFVSMGDIWHQEMDVQDIYKYCMAVRGYKNLAYMSFKPAENIFSYPTFTKFHVSGVLNKLQQIFDFIIIDCVSDISASVISSVALEMADVVYRLAGTSLKDSFFFDSNLSLLSDSRYSANRHITVLSNTKYYEPVNVYRMKYDNIGYELEFDEKLYLKVLEGNASKKIKCHYDKIISKMIRMDILKEKIKVKGSLNKRLRFGKKERVSDE